MEFTYTYTDTFYVSEDDIECMVELVLLDNYSAVEAVDTWSEDLDDADYYAVGHIKEDLIEIINDRVKKLKRKFSTNSKIYTKKHNVIMDKLLFAYAYDSDGIRANGDNTYEPTNEQGLEILEYLRDLDLITEVLDK